MWHPRRANSQMTMEPGSHHVLVSPQEGKGVPISKQQSAPIIIEDLIGSIAI